MSCITRGCRSSACLIATGGCIALALLAGSISLFALDATLALISIGMGTLLPVTTVAVQNAVAPRELGTTTAAIGFFRQLGGALMVALFGAVVLGLDAGHGVAVREALQVGASPEQTGRFSAMFLVAAGRICARVPVLSRDGGAPAPRPRGAGRIAVRHGVCFAALEGLS